MGTHTKKIEITTGVQDYVLYTPSTSILRYVRGGKVTGGLIGEKADMAFFKLLETTTEIRIHP
jgi:hypothetical protein